MFFFFSSRRRHTRFDCDWSSDVCSSDLMAPRRPTIQQILSEGAEPPSNSASTPLVCRDQEAPPSPENSIRPERPASHLTFEPGGEIKRGLEIARVTPREAALLKLDTALGGGCGAGGAATAPFTFFGFSIFLQGIGPG